MEQRWRKNGVGNLGSVWPNLNSLDHKVPNGPYFQNNLCNSSETNSSSGKCYERKICVIGNKGVGKTHIINSLGDVDWTEGKISKNGAYSRFLKKYSIKLPLLNLSKAKTSNKISDPKIYNFEFIEISSSKECDELRKKLIKKSDLIIIIYSSKDQESFNEITERWLKFTNKFMQSVFIIDNNR